jgi:PHD/YefM family antitoxin component YafN of YafNO toxin-antitoxin module
MIESTETCEREDIQSAVDRAASNKERVKVVCSGKEIAAVIPLEDLELLEELEDRLDLLDALEAIAEAKKEGGIIPWQEFKK